MLRDVEALAHHCTPREWGCIIFSVPLLETSQIAANFATVAQLGAAVATLVLGVFTYLHLATTAFKKTFARLARTLTWRETLGVTAT